MRASPVNKKNGYDDNVDIAIAVNYGSFTYLLRRELLTLAQSALAVVISLLIHSFRSSAFTMVYSSGPRGGGYFQSIDPPKSEVTIV
ncbi:hypothetical protein INT43_007059 [Umbelopsis isabellina]|uniref:Uncharacterized protein n=1 Tax=Mortierella isabellina TaxID=91625 RepID=A0A8H7PXK3_MORIS|nr:hypothetical protein INT43_007059 [Umbelopsis isabellina]